jgi:hypothetical protein
LVEHDLAKVGVAGSSPVFRSKTLSAERVFCFWILIFENNINFENDFF